ncbi:restriction endonuclease subunit R [Photobacterium aquimaris]|uniref:DEAD/DEAH box helicase family protein n=1 Tax=Photobacterium TaxID=657 RepID=UPI0007EF7A44|nr:MULTISPECIES: DEAD/DEAH box helicase family protein [Photobacterium]OBU13847.1 restriction endonuclease subunit R [Photobacterium aquimaris]PSW01482.1 restriction endonuclease subunit R [Photobacterium aquimaris]
MLFSCIGLKEKYDSDEDDILSSFHIPLLGVAARYDRAVGYFSSEVLSAAAEGVERFISSGAKMRLIIGDPLSDCEYEAVMDGIKNPINFRTDELTNILLESNDRNLKLLRYLVAKEQLEIKFAFTHQGMFHKKVGIFYQDDETVVFSGSANETLRGLSKYNSEEIVVFFSWDQDSFHKYAQIEIDNFNALWSNNKKRTKVVELDSFFYKNIQSNIDLELLSKELFSRDLYLDLQKKENNVEPIFKYSFSKSIQKLITVDIDSKLPSKPIIVKGRSFQLFPHQIEAIDNWKRAKHKGLFKLATGSGKTFTSISALVELYEERRKAGFGTFVVISVPYIELANQWVKELSPFNISPIKCYENTNNWISLLDKKILRFRCGGIPFVCVVVVNKTMSDIHFQSRICKVNNDDILFIGDECHHLGTLGYFESLPNAKYRIGLSATPFRSEDDEIEGSLFPDIVKDNLMSYFKGVVSEYTLSDAIRDGILAPYRYELVPVYFNDEEQELYEDYSLKIQRLILKAKSSGLNNEEQQTLTKWCGFRSRLLATCEGKLPALLAYFKKNNQLSLAHSLIYVGEGKASSDDQTYITKVTNSLHEFGCRVAKFTSQETSNERKRIMESFRNKTIESLVAMKVLDEGIDVPVCKSAFILASTRNPRQYVQRRGRVLRKSEGKSEALIVDFIVLPMPGSWSSFSNNLRKAELDRINDFKLTALNSKEVEERAIQLEVY